VNLCTTTCPTIFTSSGLSFSCPRTQTSIGAKGRQREEPIGFEKPLNHHFSQPLNGPGQSRSAASHKSTSTSTHGAAFLPRLPPSGRGTSTSSSSRACLQPCTGAETPSLQQPLSRSLIQVVIQVVIGRNKDPQFPSFCCGILLPVPGKTWLIRWDALISHHPRSGPCRFHFDEESCVFIHLGVQPHTVCKPMLICFCSLPLFFDETLSFSVRFRAMRVPGLLKSILRLW
jgi:hypothetical protein